jgi:DNA-binding transcriptional ArsR family regulator
MDEERLIKAFKALGDSKRFRMVREVARVGELTCGQLGERFALSQPATSHHLKVLSDAGVLLVRAQGQSHFISVNHELLDELMTLLPRTLKPARARSRR